MVRIDYLKRDKSGKNKQEVLDRLSGVCSEENVENMGKERRKRRMKGIVQTTGSDKYR